MKKFRQFLEDFTYTTKQNVTVAHVRDFVKSYLISPEIDLSDNGITLKGMLRSAYSKKLSINDDKIESNLNSLQLINNIMTDIIQSMLDDKVVNKSNFKTDDDSYPNDLKQEVISTLQSEFVFKTNLYVGKCKGVILYDTATKRNSFQFEFIGNWKKVTK